MAITMKKWKTAGVIFIAGTLLATGCAQGSRESEHPSAYEQGTDDMTGQETSQQVESVGRYPDSHTYSWEEVTVSIPDAWKGKYEAAASEGGFSLIQTASRQKGDGMGFLCGFFRTDGMVIDVPGATALAYTDTQTYYMVEPTDVTFDYEDEAVTAEYHEMYEMVPTIAAFIEISGDGVRTNPDEFVLPLSSTVRLNGDELLNFSDNELLIARNEIYARHGRKFNDYYLSRYFESRSWYEGNVSPADFDAAVLGEIEKENIKTIQSAEHAYELAHLYPLEYEQGRIAKEDLDGDGEYEQIQYTLDEEALVGGYRGILKIDGQEFFLDAFDGVWLENPHPEFYITDISPYYDGLEIAILDDGPSDDPITHFFIYENGLSYIGSVTGFPFRQQSGYNGFANEGSVTGEIVLNFTHTCRAYGSWWYDYGNRRLVYQDSGYYRIVPEYPHQLAEDITVYLAMDAGSMTRVLPAQEKVTFLATDAKEWVLVRGGDGTKGYMRMIDGKIEGLSKTPEEVFSGLGFAG